MFSPVSDGSSGVVVVVFSGDAGGESCAVGGFLGGKMRGSLCSLVRREEGSGAGSWRGSRRLGCRLEEVDGGCFGGSHGRVCIVFGCSGCIVWN
jgi:hypothetical protein